MPSRRFLVALALTAAAHGCPALAWAQETDSTRTVSPNHGGVALGLIIANAIMLFAPPSLLLLRQDSVVTDTARPAFRPQSVAIYVSGGFTDRLAPGRSKVSWTQALSVQVYSRHLLAEARVDDQGIDRAYRLRSVELGYLFYGHPRVAGGISIGVQRMGRDATQDAVTIGLPLVGFGHPAIWGRLEPRYVFSSAGVEWHYRAEIMGPVARRSPFIVGGSVEFKPLPQGGPYHGILALVIGVRP